VVWQAGEIALKFEQDRAQRVVQLVGPRLVDIGRCGAVSPLFTSRSLEHLITDLNWKRKVVETASDATAEGYCYYVC